MHGDAAASGDGRVTDGGGDAAIDGAGTGAAKDGGGDTKADSVASDARPDTPVGSGTGGAGGTVGGGSGGGGGGPGVGVGGGGGAGVPNCADCEQTYCQYMHQALRSNEYGLDADMLTLCHNPKDAAGNDAKAAAGPAMGSLKKDLCEAVLNCVHNDPGKCVALGVQTPGSEDIALCYVGDADALVTGCAIAPKGPCKTQIEAAAEVSSDATACGEVGANLTDWQTYAIGAASGLVNCDIQFCRVSCLHLPGPNRLTGDSSPSVGSGGMGAGGAGGKGSSATGGSGATGSGGVATSTGGGGGATGGSHSGGAGGSPSGTGGSAVTYDMCRQCEQSTCPESACDRATGNAAAGPATGSARKDLCSALVACIRANKCSDNGDDTTCYCGTADPTGACLSGGANGKCKAEMEAAAESVDPNIISGDRFVNLDVFNKLPYAIGYANDLIGCDAFNCGGDTGVCWKGDPPVAASGSGGAAGTGGATTTGGVVGTGGGAVHTGGVTGTGGVMGSGGAVTTGGAVGSGGTGGAAGAGAAGGTSGTAGAGAALVNSGFDSGSAPWISEYAMGVSWIGNRDAAGSLTSGSLSVTNGNVANADGSTVGGARQCVSVTAGSTYALSAQLFIPPGQGAGSAGVDVLFYPSSDCSGAIDGEYTSTLTTATNAWMTLQGTTPPPSGAKSMAVRLVIVKTFRAAAFQTYFDNVTFKPK